MDAGQADHLLAEIDLPGSEKNSPRFNPYGVRFKVDTGRRAFGLTSCEIKPTIVHWTLDNCSGNEAVGKLHVLVGAVSVRGVEPVVGRAIKNVGFAVVFEWRDIFKQHVIRRSGVDPGLAHFDLPRTALCLRCSGRQATLRQRRCIWRKLPFYEICWIPKLLRESWQNLPVSGD